MSMNRIKISPLAISDQLHPCQSDDRESGSQAVLDATPRKNCGKSSVFVPIHYEKNYAYPLLVWLGDGTNDSDSIDQLMPRISLQNYVAISPNVDLALSVTDNLDVREQVDLADAAVEAAILSASSQYNINPGRVFICGNGPGGSLAFRIAMERPDRFAGAMSLNGKFDTEAQPLMRWKSCRSLPLFWTHSRSSESFQQESLCTQLRLLHVAGFAVTLRQYPGEMEVSDKVLQDVNRWIMEIVNSHPGVNHRAAK